jgi:hypothetical protein
MREHEMGRTYRNGLVARIRGRCPAGIDERVWSWVRSLERTGVSGDIRDDRFVAGQIDAVVSGLAREFRAETAWQVALAEVRSARQMAEPAPDAAAEIGALGADVGSGRRWAEVDAERRFRDRRRIAADGADAQDRLAAATVGLEAAWTDAVDRLQVAARERRGALDRAIEALNDRLRYFGQPTVEPFPDEFTEELVRDAVRLADPLAEEMVRRVVAR